MLNNHPLPPDEPFRSNKSEYEIKVLRVYFYFVLVMTTINHFYIKLLDILCGFVEFVPVSHTFFFFFFAFDPLFIFFIFLISITPPLHRARKKKYVGRYLDLPTIRIRVRKGLKKKKNKYHFKGYWRRRGTA